MVHYTLQEFDRPGKYTKTPHFKIIEILKESIDVFQYKVPLAHLSTFPNIVCSSQSVKANHKIVY